MKPPVLISPPMTPKYISMCSPTFSYQYLLSSIFLLSYFTLLSSNFLPSFYCLLTAFLLDGRSTENRFRRPERLSESTRAR